MVPVDRACQSGSVYLPTRQSFSYFQLTGYSVPISHPPLYLIKEKLDLFVGSSYTLGIKESQVWFAALLLCLN